MHDCNEVLISFKENKRKNGFLLHKLFWHSILIKKAGIRGRK